MFGRYVTDLEAPQTLDLAADLAPHVADDGWRTLDPGDAGGYDGLFKPLIVRAGAPGHAEALIETGPRARNVACGLHGGFLASAAEQTLFLPLFMHGRIHRGGVVTIDFSLQYLTGGDTRTPILAHVELLRETGRMAFVRGELRQHGQALVAYHGTLRKLPIKA